jgi:hypothetical protein
VVFPVNPWVHGTNKVGQKTGNKKNYTLNFADFAPHAG